MRGLYPLNTIRLGRQEMSHVDSCIRIRTWTILCVGSHFPDIAEKGFSFRILHEDGKGVWVLETCYAHVCIAAARDDTDRGLWVSK